MYFAGLLTRMRQLRQAQTPAETFFWEMVRDRRFFGLKFRQQHQMGLYIVDFYCTERKLVIELDGPVHDEPRQHIYDNTRDEYLHSLGCTIFRIQNDFVLSAPEQVFRDLATVLHLPLYPWERGAGG